MHFADDWPGGLPVVLLDLSDEVPERFYLCCVGRVIRSGDERATEVAVERMSRKESRQALLGLAGFLAELIDHGGCTAQNEEGPRALIAALAVAEARDDLASMESLLHTAVKQNPVLREALSRLRCEVDDAITLTEERIAYRGVSESMMTLITGATLEQLSECLSPWLRWIAPMAINSWWLAPVHLRLMGATRSVREEVARGLSK
ncbi:MAG: hypothetical protein AAB974_02485 [Patescibacteria group bacterium]